MIRHQAIGGDPYPGLGMGLGQNLLKGDVVRRLLKQREPPDPTVQDMIRKISSCKAGAARHTALVSIPETRVMKRLPTPYIRLRFPHLSDPVLVEAPPEWLHWIDQPLFDHELTTLRPCVNRQQPFGTADWQMVTATTLGLESTLRQRGRPRTSPEK